MFNKELCFCGKTATFDQVVKTWKEFEVYKCEDGHENTYGIAEEYNDQDLCI